MIVVFRALGISNRSRSGKRTPDLGKDDQNGAGAEERSEDGEDLLEAQQSDDPQSPGHESDGSQRFDDCSLAPR